MTSPVDSERPLRFVIIGAGLSNTVWTTGCRSWYLDDRGIPASWPWPMSHFRERMRAPDLSAFELS